MSEIVREAEWLVKEEAERATARREGTVLSVEFFRRAKVPTTVAIAMAGLLAAALIPCLVNYHYGDEAAVLLAIAGFSLGLIPLAHRWERVQAKAGEADAEMRDALGRDGRFVSLIVRQGDAPTGQDRGMLWFEDGRLFFSGRRTSFGLVPSQAQGWVRMEGPVPGVRNEVNLVLTRESLAGPMVLSFGPPISQGARPGFAAHGLKTDIDRWQDGKYGRAEGPGQWPPATVGPCVVTERRLLARVLARALLLPLFPAYYVLHILMMATPLMTGIGSIAGSLALFLSPTARLLGQAWRDRRRLRRSG